MLHLDIERLAELADSEPTTVESAHLAVCEACRREREAHRQLLVLAAADRDRLAPPITSWESLAGRLRDEGMLAGTVPSGGAPLSPVEDISSVVPMHHRTRRRAAWWLQAAAGVMLAAGGAVAGRMTMPMQQVVDGPTTITDTVYLREPAPSTGGADVLPAANPKPGEQVFKPIASRKEALDLLRRAQLDYQRAAAFLAQNDTVMEAPEVYRGRLAAFDKAAQSLEDALVESPTDPVINAYYRATLQSRDVTLQQLGSAVRLVRY